MKVAVIGAGACGLPATKCCLDEGFDVVCFEQRDDVGGLWYYQDEVKDGQGIVMKMTVANTNKEVMSYSDFLSPLDFPLFMPHANVLAYYRMYAEHFQLRKHIRFQTEVTRVKQAADFSNTGRWEVTSKDLKTNNTTTEVFDAVMICHGHEAVRYRPHFDNEEEFQGEILHSHEYRDGEKFKGKRVVVVAFGNSACDIACELADICDQVYMSVRTGAWLMSRIWDNGEPWESCMIRRSTVFKESFLPQSFVYWQKRQSFQFRLDHDLYGIRPDYEYGQQFPSFNEFLPSKLINGTVKIRTTIRRLTRNGVEFADGSMVEDIDAIICCTGYECGFPFVEHKSFAMKKKNEANLYNLIFPPDIHPSTIAVIGLIDLDGSIAVTGELQCRYAARVFKGTIKLPDAETMRKTIADDRETCKAFYAPTSRQFLMREVIPYCDELAKAIGCKPPGFLSLLVSDPKLAKAVYFGPFTWHQYRLVGPGAWSGARDAVIGVQDRLNRPFLESGRSTTRKSNGGGILWMTAAAFVLIAVFVVIVVKL